MKRTPLFLLLPLLLSSCMSSGLDGDGVFPLDAKRGKRTQLRYVDGQVSVNDSCMIQLENRLNPRIPPSYVNGRPMGFC